MKKISTSPISSDDTYFSLKSSSSSKSTRNSENELSFKLPLGLEGNIANDVSEDESSQLEEMSLIEDCKRNAQIDPVSKTSSSTISKCDLVDSGTGETEMLVDDADDVTSSKLVKIVIECSGTKSLKKQAEDYDTPEGGSFKEMKSLQIDIENNESHSESNDSINKVPMFKWTKENIKGDCETLKLQVNKQDDEGKEKYVSIVTLSEVIPMFYSESKEEVKVNNSTKTEILKGDVHLADNSQFKVPDEESSLNVSKVLEKEIHSLPTSEGVAKSDQYYETDDVMNNRNVKDTLFDRGDSTENNLLDSKQTPQDSTSIDKRLNQDITIDGMPLPQVLEEILKRGKISSSPDTLKKTSCNFINSNDDFNPVSSDLSFTIPAKELEDNIKQENTGCISVEKYVDESMSNSGPAEIIADPISQQTEASAPGHQTICMTEQEANMETVPENTSVIRNSLESAESQKAFTSQDFPENEIAKEVTYDLEPVSDLAEDPAANIELQMSEGDSIECRQNYEETDTEEPVYEKLKTVDFSSEADDVFMEDNFEEEYDRGK